MKRLVHRGLLMALPFLCFILEGCEGEADTYSCQADSFTCTGLSDYCDEKERQCGEMEWNCIGGKLNCTSEDKDICDQLEIDCSKEKDSVLTKKNKKKAQGSSFIQATSKDDLEAADTSVREAIHRHRKKLLSNRTSMST